MEQIFLMEQKIRELLAEKQYPSIKQSITQMNPADLAAVFSLLPEPNLPVLYRLLPKELAAETFVEMDTDLQQLLLTGFSDAEIRCVMEELYADDAADLLDEMPAGVVKRILAQTDPQTRREINELLRYPEDSAGGIMTTEYVTLRPDMTAMEAIARIRTIGLDKETINTCYVTDNSRHLIGVLSIRTLILSEESAKLDDIMMKNVISVTTTEDQETVAKKLAHYDLTAIPVVDGEGRLVGIVTIDDAVDVIMEEAEEDMELMAAITPTDKPYIKTPVVELWKKRVPWLLILMLSATFTGIIITGFESALSSAVVLTAYIPMLMGTGGNCGSQASVSVIRSLASGEVQFRDTFKVLWKELRVSALCGLSLALVGFVKMLLLDGVGTMVSLVVAITLFFTAILAKLIGCSLPILAKKCRLDPAVCASPFITTIVDALSLLVYFAIATSLLQL